MVKSKIVWTESVVEHQLRCGGLVEALNVLKLGYPTPKVGSKYNLAVSKLNDMLEETSFQRVLEDDGAELLNDESKNTSAFKSGDKTRFED